MEEQYNAMKPPSVTKNNEYKLMKASSLIKTI